MTIDKIIEDMGYDFRSLVLHSDGRWSCLIGYDVSRRFKGDKEFWGDTAIGVLEEAYNIVKEQRRKEYNLI